MGLIDGTHIRIQAPTLSAEVRILMAYVQHITHYPTLCSLSVAQNKTVAASYTDNNSIKQFVSHKLTCTKSYILFIY